MRNTGLMRCTTASAESFTTEAGIKLRRTASPILRKVLRLAVKRKIVVEQYPVLKQGQPYILRLHTFLMKISLPILPLLTGIHGYLLEQQIN